MLDKILKCLKMDFEKNKLYIKFKNYNYKFIKTLQATNVRFLRSV